MSTETETNDDPTEEERDSEEAEDEDATTASEGAQTCQDVPEYSAVGGSHGGGGSFLWTEKRRR